jgi:hypothetical protein
MAARARRDTGHASGSHTALELGLLALQSLGLLALQSLGLLGLQ